MTMAKRKRWSGQDDYQKAYDKANMRQFGVKYHVVSDADVIEALTSAKNKSDFIRHAIRYYLKNGCPGWEAADETEDE